MLRNLSRPALPPAADHQPDPLLRLDKLPERPGADGGGRPTGAEAHRPGAAHGKPPRPGHPGPARPPPPAAGGRLPPADAAGRAVHPDEDEAADPDQWTGCRHRAGRHCPARPAEPPKGARPAGPAGDGGPRHGTGAGLRPARSGLGLRSSHRGWMRQPGLRRQAPRPPCRRGRAYARSRASGEGRLAAVRPRPEAVRARRNRPGACTPSASGPGSPAAVTSQSRPENALRYPPALRPEPAPFGERTLCGPKEGLTQPAAGGLFKAVVQGAPIGRGFIASSV